jgi:hypothetical protein
MTYLLRYGITTGETDGEHATTFGPWEATDETPDAVAEILATSTVSHVEINYRAIRLQQAGSVCQYKREVDA